MKKQEELGQVMLKPRKKEEKRKTILGILMLTIFFIVIFIGLGLGLYQKGVEDGQKNKELELEITKNEADSKVESIQKEMNDKIEAFEQKIMQECDNEKYEMLEECFNNINKLKKGEKIQFSYKSLKMDSVNIPSLSQQDGSINDEKVLSYLKELKEIVEKYPLSFDINLTVIYRLEELEDNFKNEISSETFKKIWALKKQCENNNSIWIGL